MLAVILIILAISFTLFAYIFVALCEKEQDDFNKGQNKL